MNWILKKIIGALLKVAIIKFLLEQIGINVQAILDSFKEAENAEGDTTEPTTV